MINLRRDIPRLTCYLIPGLGATAEIFNRLEMPNHVTTKPVDWISPEKGESLAHYAGRLVPQIEDRPCIILGCSFGGAVAIELAKLCNPQLTVLVSSIPSGSYIPQLYRAVKWLGGYQVAASGCRLPAKLLRMPLAMAFCVEEKSSLDMLCDQVKSADPAFLRWAIGALMKWEGDAADLNHLHIHGDRDRILPLGKMKPDLIIAGGGHFLVHTHAAEVGKFISSRISALEVCSGD